MSSSNNDSTAAVMEVKAALSSSPVVEFPYDSQDLAWFITAFLGVMTFVIYFAKATNKSNVFVVQSFLALLVSIQFYFISQAAIAASDYQYYYNKQNSEIITSGTAET